MTHLKPSNGDVAARALNSVPGLTAACRDAVKPWEVGRHQDCFGLTNLAAPVRISSRPGARARVLVCAPSNSALDELLRRILQHGVRDR